MRREQNAVHQLDWYLKQLALPETTESLRREYITASKRLIDKLDSACKVWERASPTYRGRIEKYEGNSP
jgi:hypothetical protein